LSNLQKELCTSGSNPVPANPPGDADIGASGDCTISHSVTGSGYIHITAGGAVTTQTLTSVNDLTISAQTSFTVTGNLEGESVTATTTGGNITISGTVTSDDGQVQLTGNAVEVCGVKTFAG
jgi:osmotically-inducible protein OsmY